MTGLSEKYGEDVFLESIKALDDFPEKMLNKLREFPLVKIMTESMIFGFELSKRARDQPTK